MIPVAPVGIIDEGYTSSPNASECSSIEMRNEQAAQWSTSESPSGTSGTLFPRFEGYESVSVTQVDPSARNAAQMGQKQQKVGRGPGDPENREGRGRSRSQQDLSMEPRGPVTAAASHRKVKIPPMPKSYSLMALNQKFYKNVPPIPPELSKEEKNANFVSGIRNEVTFDQVPLIPPKPLPSKVHFLGFTEDGTVMITFLDEKNQGVFERNLEKIEMWFGYQRFVQLDTRIQKEDVFRRRIVLVSIPRRDGSHLNMRAIISDFNDKWVIVDGLDYPVCQRKVSYDNVYYQLKDYNFSPYQLQEVHLEGLEKYEGSPVFGFVINKMKRGIVEWANQEKLKVPDYLDLKKIRKGEDGYKVSLAYPEDFLDGMSLNKIMMEGMRTFDPFVDYLVTP